MRREYLQHFPKDRYRTEVESWRELQSQNIEFAMKRLREPIERGRRRSLSEQRYRERVGQDTGPGQ